MAQRRSIVTDGRLRELERRWVATRDPSEQAAPWCLIALCEDASREADRRRALRELVDFGRSLALSDSALLGALRTDLVPWLLRPASREHEPVPREEAP
jgi:hypothetical protein